MQWWLTDVIITIVHSVGVLDQCMPCLGNFKFIPFFSVYNLESLNVMVDFLDILPPNQKTSGSRLDWRHLS